MVPNRTCPESANLAISNLPPPLSFFILLRLGPVPGPHPYFILCTPGASLTPTHTYRLLDFLYLQTPALAQDWPLKELQPPSLPSQR
ncbi:hypothetical protein DPMN_112482 [Dreissena polymorpha]|uniref:Uncharacterized protein n=1 Tax=Dreissena polymorpha TaxID=45954 RepID=A0A9D4KFQ7_DREPO|nr:hypothetical protein DPMN_112482 [Dreissena polymorpha]